MSSRLSISTTDLRRLLDLTDLAHVDEPGGPLPWSVLNGLADLIGCDSVTTASLSQWTVVVSPSLAGGPS